MPCLLASQVTEIRRRRLKGERAPALAAAFGVNVDTIYYHTRDLGVRSPQGPAVPPGRDARLLAAWRSGADPKLLAERFGFSRSDYVIARVRRIEQREAGGAA